MSTPTQVVTSPAGLHSPLIHFFERVPVIAGSAVAIVGALVLLGRAVDVPLRESGIQMHPITALCFVLTGGSLLVAVRSRRTPKTEAVQQTLAAAVATIGILILYEYIRGAGPQLDLWPFGAQARQAPTAPPSRIPINSVACLLLYALALLSI